MGLNYSGLLISGKSPLDEFEHARKTICSICHGSWQVRPERSACLGLMPQFQDLSCTNQNGLGF